MAKSTFAEKLRNIGPGALVAAGFVGPGTVTTCTVSGASYGYTLLWALLFATVATIIFQEMAARVGIVTGKGLGENIRERITHPVLKWIAIIVVIIAIFIGNIAYETGNVTGGILGIQAVFPSASMVAIAVVIGIIGFAMLWIGSYKVVEKILTAIVVFMGVVFLITAFASPVDWGAALAGLFTPSLPSTEQTGGTSPILVVTGLIGTTIVPYNLFLHASGAAERFKDPEQVADARFDAVVSIGVGGLISMAILICAAANIHGTGVAVTNGKDMAIALQPLMGEWATVMIGLGLLAAGFSSVLTASLSIVLVSGVAMAVALGKSPTQLILTAQAANAILLPIMAFFTIYCANGADLGTWRNHAFANTAGVVIVIVTLFICFRNMSSFITSVSKLIGA